MLAADFPVQTLCEVLALPTSTYYYQPHGPADLEIREAIEAIAVEFPRYGYRRITAELKRRGRKVNHKQVLRLVREENLLAEVRQYCQTTNSQHGYGRYPNLVKKLEVVRPDQVWAADITYIRMPRQFVYLAVLLDLFTLHCTVWFSGEQEGHERACDLVALFVKGAADRKDLTG